MKSIKSKITKVIRESNGFPNYSRREYLQAIRLVLVEKLTEQEVTSIQNHKINLDKWIMEITTDITEDLF